MSLLFPNYFNLDIFTNSQLLEIYQAFVLAQIVQETINLLQSCHRRQESFNKLDQIAGIKAANYKSLDRLCVEFYIVLRTERIKLLRAPCRKFPIGWRSDSIEKIGKSGETGSTERE